MFNLFKAKKPFEPLDYEQRKYFENNLLWLNQEFPEPPIEKRKVFRPTYIDFPIQWENSEENAKQVLRIVAENMQIDLNEIEIDFYDNGIKEINMGTSTIFLETDTDIPEASGFYHGKNQNGCYQISLDRGNLDKQSSVIATIAHELSHVKLLGQKNMEVNDEQLTDLATVFFGFGIFNANSAFQFFQQRDRWGSRNLGYLTQEEWAYTLALLAFIRYEDKPDWSEYLNATIKADFEKSINYILENEETIFKFDDEVGQ